MPSIPEIVDALLQRPSPESGVVSIEPAAMFGWYEVACPNAGRLLLREGELAQIFDLLVSHFGLDVERPLAAHLGFWAEDMWGRDPREGTHGR